MRYLSVALMTFFSVIVWFLASCIFVVGVPLLVNRSLSTAGAVGGMVLYSAVALAVAFGGWRIFAVARKMSVA